AEAGSLSRPTNVETKGTAVRRHLLTFTLLAVGLALPAAVVAHHDPQGGSNSNDNSKVTICHNTGSATNPWVEITISTNALPAHSGSDFVVSAGPACPPAAPTTSPSATPTTSPSATPTATPT